MIIWKLIGTSAWDGSHDDLGFFTTKEKAEAKMAAMIKTAKANGWSKRGFVIHEVVVQ